MANMHGLSETSYNKAGRDGQMRLAHLSMEWQAVYGFCCYYPVVRPAMYFICRYNQSLSVVRSGAADGPSSGLEGRHPMMHTAAFSVLSARVCGGVIILSFVGIPSLGSHGVTRSPAFGQARLAARPTLG